MTVNRNDSRIFQTSYSGSDARAFVYFSQMPSRVEELIAMQTVSFSVYEAKGEARALGFRGIRGKARGVRTIAGSMILTVLNDHPLAPLLRLSQDIKTNLDYGRNLSSTFGWSVDSQPGKNGQGINRGSGNYWGRGFGDGIAQRNELATLIPPFNLAVLYATERVFHKGYHPGTTWRPSWESSNDPQGNFMQAGAWQLVGVEFITEGMVTSIHDTLTEVTVQFTADDLMPFTLNTSQFDIEDIVRNRPPAQSLDHLWEEISGWDKRKRDNIPEVDRFDDEIQRRLFDSADWIV